jgi:hypothetical protein
VKVDTLITVLALLGLAFRLLLAGLELDLDGCADRRRSAPSSACPSAWRSASSPA